MTYDDWLGTAGAQLHLELNTAPGLVRQAQSTPWLEHDRQTPDDHRDPISVHLDACLRLRAHHFVQFYILDQEKFDRFYVVGPNNHYAAPGPPRIGGGPSPIDGVPGTADFLLLRLSNDRLRIGASKRCCQIQSTACNLWPKSA